jgi:hypothetical protein
VSTDFNYTQHPRATERAVQGPPTVHAVLAKWHAESGRVNRINQKIGLGITKRVGTMWAAYAFAALSLVSLPAAIQSHDSIVIIAWVAQTFLQLVLLPIIIVGQNIQAAASDARAAATYEDAGAILEEAKQIQLHLASQDAAIGALLDKVKTLEEHTAAS